jgi:predicted kinase
LPPASPRAGPAGPLRIPERALVVLVGAAGAGKTTFAARHFDPGDIVSSDALRIRLAGDEADQSRNRTVFSILHREVVRRLAARRLVVVDATNVETRARRELVGRARLADVPAIAIVLALPGDVVRTLNSTRTGRVVDAGVVDRHLQRVAEALDADFAGEGFAAIHVVRSIDEADALVVELEPAPTTTDGRA